MNRVVLAGMYSEEPVVYCFHCLINGKKYIGASTMIRSRIYQHRANVKGNLYPHIIFYQEVRKYGWENFIFGIIEYTDKESIDERERYWIKEYKTLTEGYNMTSGGKGLRDRTPDIEERRIQSRSGYVTSESTKEKLRITSSKLKHSPETIQLIKQNRRNQKVQPFTGRKHSEEVILKRSCTYLITYDNGRTEEVTNLARFARENGYLEQSIHKIKKGEMNKHKNIVGIQKLD